MLCIAGKEEAAISLAEETHQLLTLAEAWLSFTVAPAGLLSNGRYFTLMRRRPAWHYWELARLGFTGISGQT